MLIRLGGALLIEGNSVLYANYIATGNIPENIPDGEVSMQCTF